MTRVTIPQGCIDLEEADANNVWTSAFRVVPEGGLVASMQPSVEEEKEEDEDYGRTRGPIGIWAASLQLSMELGEPGKLTERPPYADLINNIEEDRRVIPTKELFCHFGTHGTIGRSMDGGLIVEDDGGIIVYEIDPMHGEEVDEMLRDLTMKHRAEEITYRKRKRLWERIWRKTQDQTCQRTSRSAACYANVPRFGACTRPRSM
jgi:hypothetical protein